MPDKFVTSIDKNLTEDDLLKLVDLSRLPRHICIIMDGNRRWAKERNLPVVMGHQEGVKAFKKVLTGAVELGIEVISVYAFSMENWKRTEKEVDFLMKLFRTQCFMEKDLMRDKGVQFRVLGERETLSPDLRKVFEDTEEYTKECSRTRLNLCVNYSSRYEIMEAAKSIARDIKEGRIQPEDLDEELFSKYLYTGDIPDPDLMIRTSGEMRISNFMLWQNAYSEFCFTDIYWPDFDKAALLQAIYEYQKRDRRFGGGSCTKGK